MLADDIAGRAYSKAQHNRLLQAVIGRPRGSMEYKHQNISAVLKDLGEDWIPGCKPAFNFQASLVDAVVRWLNRHPDWLVSTARMAMNPSPSALQEEAMLWIGPPPTHSNAPPPNELERMTAIARKYDVAERDARNRVLGRAGEERISGTATASIGCLTAAIAASIGAGAGGFAHTSITMRSLTPFGAMPSGLRLIGRPACSRPQ